MCVLETPSRGAGPTSPGGRPPDEDREDILRLIRTTPGITKDGKPFDHYEQRMMREGTWRLELIPAEILGLARPLEVHRAERASRFIEPWDRDDGASYCPKHWADIKIGKGACGLRCVICFLIATHRAMCNPTRHLLYENVETCLKEVERWLKRPNRACLGLGIDCSDSLLYEGVTGHARRIIPLIALPRTNPSGVNLILLTKSKNVRYLKGLPTRNVVGTFSLNPEPIADLWEGRFPDGVRVTPPIAERVEASLRAQEMGFEIRWRIDPILMPCGWEDTYREFFLEGAKAGARPTRVTLGTYRENSRSLRTLAAKWGLPAMQWEPPTLVKEGMHYHVPKAMRAETYRRVAGLIRDAWAGTGHTPTVALCKEPVEIRRAVGLDHDMCNCGP